MDKKHLLKVLPPDDLRGFEEFVEGQSENRFLPKPPPGGTKKETSFEHFTFLTTDAIRLSRLNVLLNEKLPFAAKYEQGNWLLKEQREEIQELQKKLFAACDQATSPYRRSMQETFDSFFDA
ncbi:MAG TPA: hypothetical protein VNJ08_16150 [Bacteriovoracaceae bacterium]|nr:hypothetical protein [Bacteriovoracaceae bacterium]